MNTHRVRRGRAIKIETEVTGDNPKLTKSGKVVHTPAVQRGIAYVPGDRFVECGGGGKASLKLGSATIKVVD